MALAFNVQRAGPLAQVSIGPGELMAAYQIATGVYGWWKARERTESLIHMLESHQCALSAPSSFNQTAYIRARGEHGRMMGVIVQNGATSSVPLPKASTALPNDRGQACLRALTCAILCLYGTVATTAILREIIPSALLHRDLEDLDVDFNDGPLVPALSQWVNAVAAEENCDAMSERLLRQVAMNEQHLSGVPLEDILNSNMRDKEGELPFVSGVIKWALTSSAQRKHKTYATRSIRAWSMASILSNLGFEVLPARYIASSADHQSFSMPPEIYVVATSGPETDYLSNSFRLKGAQKTLEDNVRPVVTPLSGIPVVVFRRFSGSPYHFDISRFQEAFTSSFLQARNKREAYYASLQSSHDDAVLDQSSTLPELHKCLWPIMMNSKLRSQSQSLKNLAQFTSMHGYVPQSVAEDPSWHPDLIYISLHYDRDPTILQPIQKQGIYNCNILKALVLGSIYGWYSHFIKGSDISSILHEDVIINPKIADQKVFMNLCDLAGNEFLTTAPFLRTFSHLFLGDDLIKMPLGSDILDSGILGRSLNGFTLLSELLEHFRIPFETQPLRITIVRGQVLNLPTDRMGYIRSAPLSGGSSSSYAGKGTEVDFGQPVSAVHVRTDTQISKSLRIDAEACWNMNPQEIIWKVRHNGIPLGSITLGHVQSYISSNRECYCSCKHYYKSAKLSNEQGEQWYQLSVAQLLETVPNGLPFRSKGRLRLFVDASASETTTIVARHLLGSPDFIVVAWDCVRCALRKFRRLHECGPPFLVLLVTWTIHEQ